jgi:hypothetical protein
MHLKHLQAQLLALDNIKNQLQQALLREIPPG